MMQTAEPAMNFKLIIKANGGGMIPHTRRFYTIRSARHEANRLKRSPHVERLTLEGPHFLRRVIYVRGELDPKLL